jgi:single-stranded-DNA-specific exonuclease
MDWIDLPSSNIPPPLPGLHPIVVQALLRLGLTTPPLANAFLDPAAYLSTPALELPNLSPALYRIERAILTREPICIWGDFDVDGQTSTTILVEALQILGGEVNYHIPIRATEGHGINLANLEILINNGTKLLVSCDTGITAQDAISYAQSRGVDVIITDHHDLPEELPQAIAVIDPKMLPDQHPLATLSGAGVAFKLAEELFARKGRSNDSNRFLDLVALGLVADVAQLTGDTRNMVQKGLEALSRTDRLGLKVLMELSGLDPANITEEHIGFILGPRLNALGRLGDANPAVEFLSTADPSRAKLLAAQLENYNAQRQFLCNQVMEAVEAQLRTNPNLLENPIIILNNPSWPPSVVGIVASRLVGRYNKPAILFSTPVGEPARGSARSVAGLNITTAIATQKDILINFGGHPMAAGLSLDKDKLDDFTRRLFQVVEKMTGVTVHEKPHLEINTWLELPDITLDLADALKTLAPFGHGNEKPILAASGLHLKTAQKIGRNHEHLKLIIYDDAGNTQNVLWWNGAGEILPEGKFDLAFTVRASDWQGNRQVQMEFEDFRLVDKAPIIELKTKVEVIDYRKYEDKSKLLSRLQDQPSTLTWAEAEARKDSRGKDRTEFAQADNLIIWSIPPSSEVLHSALEMIHPKRVYIIAAESASGEIKRFLARLSGLLKYMINHRDGKTSYQELAAATGQRLSTIELGLNWLVSCGKITLKHQEDDQLWVTYGEAINDPGGAARLRTEISELLAETTAYRAFFMNADKNALIP